MCTVAWCKMYEMTYGYKLVPEDCTRAVCSLHLCEVRGRAAHAGGDEGWILACCSASSDSGGGGVQAPGAFICALNHYLASERKALHGKWSWTGLTLNPYYEGNDPTMMVRDATMASTNVCRNMTDVAVARSATTPSLRTRIAIGILARITRATSCPRYSRRRYLVRAVAGRARVAWRRRKTSNPYGHAPDVLIWSRPTDPWTPAPIRTNRNCASHSYTIAKPSERSVWRCDARRDNLSRTRARACSQVHCVSVERSS